MRLSSSKTLDTSVGEEGNEKNEISDQVVEEFQQKFMEDVLI